MFFLVNNPNPMDVILWTLRRREGDVVNLYNYLSGLMQISTGGNFLNFGYWDDGTENPLDSQKNLCDIVGKMAELDGAEYILDVGSGFSEPAFLWKKNYPDINIICININSNQLILANRENTEKSQGIGLLNSTAVKIPIADQSCDRMIALESAQHFRPIRDFISETRRILKKDGLAVLAIPILSRPSRMSILEIGILKFTWSSEHYDLENIKKTIQEAGLSLLETKMIGSNVYLPLADYYIKNRQILREEILKRYPSYVEKILFKSMLKMKQAAMNHTIEYVLIKCKK
jgi:ubiquinone/menaquinone biosynthesis C-methylase UbiE